MLLDITVGILFTTIFGLLTDDLSLSLLLFGTVSAIIVDLDFIIWLFRNNWKVDGYSHEHRDYLHIPLLFTCIFTLFWKVVQGNDWGIIWFVMTLYHFIHDTFSGGWGIRWLYPFHRGYWTKVKYSPRTFYRDRAEQREFVKKHGDPNWIETEKKRWWHYLIGIVYILIYFSLIYVIYGW